MQRTVPLISVVIPLYNRESLIEKTINSVISQDFEYPIEILVVDDGSKDQSAQKVKDIGDERIRYFYQNNSGANTARNRGIDEARGKYVAFLDSDDMFFPSHLANSYEVVKQNDNLVAYSKILVDRGGGRTFLKPPRPMRKGEHISEYMLCDRGFFQTSTLVLSRNLAAKVRFREGLPFGQDTDFVLRLFNYGANFAMIDVPGAIWRDVEDPKRISNKWSAEKRLAWLDQVKNIITKKAFYADKGWVVAKAYSVNGRKILAFKLYINAILRRCYSAKMAVVVFMQIFFVGRAYRVIADKYLETIGKFK